MDWRPASLSQECGMFCAALTRVHPAGAGTPNIGRQIVLTGEVDEYVVQRSVNRLISRCEMLRARLHRIPDRTPGEGNIRLGVYKSGGSLIPGMFTQCIKERGMVRLGVHRVSNRNGDHAKIARSLLRQELRTPFDLERSPLVRATLIRIGPEKALLQLVAHPLICDESSLRILARQLRHCCPFAIQSSSSCLDLAHTAYSATSFNGQLPRPSSSELAAGLDFWQSYWAEFGFARLASRNLPFANEFTGRTGKISAAQRFLEPALTSRVLRFAREQRFTLFVLTFAALAVVLSHHCGQDRVALRRRFANRVVGENYRAVGALE